MRRIQGWYGSFVAVLVSGCASLPAGQIGTDQAVITRDEIVRSGAATAYDAIRNARPLFLGFRGVTTVSGKSSPYPTVWLDGMEYGSIETLRGIPAGEIHQIQIFRTAIPSVFGTQNTSGVIAITTRH
ncbi:MAG TPA: TonB-dependent receptor plug domain-containing protein [Gemmatimonadaceae bacterium]|nr:TonB-dependent receptor plug domain-containing protein [Gemmatimonadaceae bacterium]